MKKPRTCPRIDLIMGTDLVDAYQNNDDRAIFYLDDFPESVVKKRAASADHVCVIGYCLDVYGPQQQVAMFLAAIRVVVKNKLAAGVYSNNLLHLYALNNCLLLHVATKKKGTLRKPLPAAMKRYVAVAPRWVRYVFLEDGQAPLTWRRATADLIDERVLGDAADQLSADFNVLLQLDPRAHAYPVNDSSSSTGTIRLTKDSPHPVTGVPAVYKERQT